MAKEVGFNLEHAREMFMKAKKSFAEASASRSNDKLDWEMDPSMPTTFLETRMNFLRDSKVVKGLHELIKRYTGNTPSEPCVV